MQQIYRYRNIIIKPHWMQFVINELHLLVLISVGFVYAGIDDAVLSTFGFCPLCLAFPMLGISNGLSMQDAVRHQ